MPEPETDALVHDFERDGFVHAGRVLEPSETAALADELERYIDTLFRGRDAGIQSPWFFTDVSREPTRNHFQITDLWRVSEPFRRLVENPTMAAIAARLARASSLQVWSDTVQYKPPREGAAFEWHQDGPYHKSTSPSSRLLAAWIALDDADEDSGCMWMVPGSHRWGDQTFHLASYAGRASREEFVAIGPPPGSLDPEAPWRAPVPCPVKAGEVHFHHGYTWHGSPSNASPRRRAGYTLFYMPDGVFSATADDPRITVPIGTPMIEAGANFPVVYRG